MKNLLVIALLIGICTLSTAQNVIVQGMVTYENEPLQGATVNVLGSKGGTLTNKTGEFRIMAEKNQILEFTHVDMVTLEAKIKNPEDELLVIMERKLAVLPEVVVEEKRKKTQKLMAKEYFDNYDIVKTKFGYWHKDKSAYPIRIVKGDMLPLGNQHFLQALEMVLPLVRVTTGFEPKAFLRGGSSLRSQTPVIYDLDGQTLVETPVGLTISEIDRIAVIPSTSAAVKYGKLGVGGVIVINTKTTQFTELKEDN